MHRRCILDLVVKHGIVRLLVVINELVNVLVDLNRIGSPSVSVLELNVVLPWLLRLCLNLDRIARFFEDLGSLVWDVIFMFLGVCCSTLTDVDVDVEVLASCNIVVPT